MKFMLKNYIYTQQQFAADINSFVFGLLAVSISARLRWVSSCFFSVPPYECPRRDSNLSTTAFYHIISNPLFFIHSLFRRRLFWYTENVLK